MRILVIDGETPYFRLLAWGLREAGHDVMIGLPEHAAGVDAIVVNAALAPAARAALQRLHRDPGVRVVELYGEDGPQLPGAAVALAPRRIVSTGSSLRSTRPKRMPGPADCWRRRGSFNAPSTKRCNLRA
jgi:hypothetical protein